MSKTVMRLLLIGIISAVLVWSCWTTRDHNTQSAITQGVEVSIVEPSDIQEDERWDNETGRAVAHLEDARLIINTARLQIDAPIVAGVSLESLSQGVGHHSATAEPNATHGNVVLSGHRWYPGDNPYHRVLIDLDRLEEGDSITIIYQGRRYQYRVVQEKIVAPDAVEILAQTAEPQLTLYTCTPKYTAEKRLVYIAKLIDVE